MKLNARFESKANAIDVQPFRIVALEKLNDTQWQYFSQSMLEDHNMIRKHADSLFVDSNGVTNALLVLNEKTGEGILVNSEGSAYARYSAYLPFAKPYLDYELALIADYCVTEGTGNTTDGVWAISFDDIYEHFDMEISKDNGLSELLLEELKTMDEIEDAVITEDEFTMHLNYEYCLRYDPKEPQQPLPKEQYKVIDQDDFEVAYAKHILWLNDVPGGEQLDLSGCYLDLVNMSNRKLLNAKITDSVLKNVSLEGSSLCFANMSGSYFENCSMKNTAADEIDLRSTAFKNCDLSYILLMHGNFAYAKFYKSDLFNCRILNSCFEGTMFIDTDTKDQYIDTDSTMTDREWELDVNGTEQEMQ